MLLTLRDLVTKNLRLKFIALMLALVLWFYLVNELQQGTDEERMLIQKMLPSEAMVSKKLIIKPIFIGRPHRGYTIAYGKVVTVPAFCIVVGPRETLAKVHSAYTTPIDVSDAVRSFNKSVPLNPIAPGIYLEETLVQVTVPIQKVEKEPAGPDGQAGS